METEGIQHLFFYGIITDIGVSSLSECSFINANKISFFASGAWREQVLALLQSTQELELRLSCLRYFGKYPDERVRPLLYSLGRQTEAAQWEPCAVCMSVLAAYPGEETLSVLKLGLRSRNWYIRYNAALSLRALHVSPEQVQDILTGEDRYAREMLQYRLDQRANTHALGEKVPV